MRSKNVTTIVVSGLLVCALGAATAADKPPIDELAQVPDIDVPTSASEPGLTGAIDDFREEDLQMEEEAVASELVVEYVVVDFNPKDDFRHIGHCATVDEQEEELQAADIGVIVQGVCMGRVGELIMMTAGVYRITVDVAGAMPQVVTIEDSTAQNPIAVTVPVSSE